MADLIKSIKEKNTVACDQQDLLSYNFGGFANEILKTMSHFKSSEWNMEGIILWKWNSL